MSYANILFAPCIVVQCIATCFKWNKRNKRLEAEGRLGGSVDPEKLHDPEYKAWHEAHFGEAAKKREEEAASERKTDMIRQHAETQRSVAADEDTQKSTPKVPPPAQEEKKPTTTEPMQGQAKSSMLDV